MYIFLTKNIILLFTILPWNIRIPAVARPKSMSYNVSLRGVWSRILGIIRREEAKNYIRKECADINILLAECASLCLVLFLFYLFLLEGGEEVGASNQPSTSESSEYSKWLR